MSALLRQLHNLSYSRTGLAKSCGFILLMGFALAGITGTILAYFHPEPFFEKDLIRNIEHQYFAAKNSDLQTIPGQIQAATSMETQGQLFFPPTESWLPALEQSVIQPRPEPGKRFALGLWMQGEGNVEEAVALFHRENADYPHPLVRDWELRTLIKTGNIPRIHELRQLPGYADQANGLFMMRLGITNGDWSMIIRNFWDAQYRRLPKDQLFLALISGAIWTLLILSLFPHFRTVYIPLSLLALTLGWISTWPTIWSDIWMNQQFGLKQGNDFLSSLLYFLVSVGLREEVCKLLLFTPFLFRVIKPGRDLEALLFGALVGLGFAIEENINYFNSYQGSGVVVIRFVSANLLHLSLTAVTSLALTRAIRDPGKWIADSVQVLAIAIGLHGFYNTLFTHPVPGLGDMSYFSGAVLAGCSYLLFREVQTLAPMRGFKISRTAIFCWGFCLLLNLELLGAVAFLPFTQAVYLTGQAALSVVFTGYVFLHQIQEPLTD